MRHWQVERRRRTRHLIELGGLVVKAGIVDLTNDDRATIYGAMIWIAEKLSSEGGERARRLEETRKDGVRDGAFVRLEPQNSTAAGLSVTDGGPDMLTSGDGTRHTCTLPGLSIASLMVKWSS